MKVELVCRLEKRSLVLLLLHLYCKANKAVNWISSITDVVLEGGLWTQITIIGQFPILSRTLMQEVFFCPATLTTYYKLSLIRNRA